jgi:L-seryl-tRNA(Ser) seleniumtransferase
MNGLVDWIRKSQYAVTRRGLFQRGGLAALLGVPGLQSKARAALEVGPRLYESIGVRPVINCKGTFTIISGSLVLPEVREAMLAASQRFVHIDELMDAAGARIAEITGAESAIVTCGCAAALAHATAGAVAGGDPEKIQGLPDLEGLKNEVVAPGYSRNVYDHAIRMVGVKMVTVSNLQEMGAALGPKTALVTVLASPSDTGPFGLEPIAKLAHERGVPVLVDAAAEGLTIPDIHLERGADLVAYSGGKALRGPQSAGLLMGRKDLVRAAWINSAPHHAAGRAMKVGKEDIMGMLAAVEMWVKRDHEAEWKSWMGWLDEIAESVKRVDGVSAEVLQPSGLSNYSPRLEIRWDGDQLGVYGTEIEKRLWNGDPRIVLASGTGSRREGGISSVTVMPWQMSPGEATVVAGALRQSLASPPSPPGSAAGRTPDRVGGQWDVEIDFPVSPARHTIFLEQSDGDLRGSHRGYRTGGDLSGWVDGNRVHFTSRHRWEGAVFGFAFDGTVQDDRIEGEVDLGEYFTADFSAQRHAYGTPAHPSRPRKNV